MHTIKQEHRLAVLAEVEAQRALDDASRESTPSEWEHRKAEADTARKTSAEAEESYNNHARTHLHST